MSGQHWHFEHLNKPSVSDQTIYFIVIHFLETLGTLNAFATTNLP